MTIHIENEQPLDFGFAIRPLAEQVILQAMDQEGCPYEAEVSLTFTNDAEIHRINLEFRKIDRPTDVLSFPMTDFPSPASFAFLEEEGNDSFNPETGELLLGDIVISVERAMQQAEAYGHSLKREIAFLIAHSMLHLMGYDHMTPEEASVMEKKQEEILLALGITRDACLIK